MYKEDCGRFGSFQVNHVVRLRKARKQTLTGKEADAKIDALLTEPEAEQLAEDVQSGKRNRIKPLWHDDYCFSISRSDMAKTKTTPRKPQVICTLCKTEVPPGETYGSHILKCVKSGVKCKDCEKDFKTTDCLEIQTKHQHSTGRGSNKPEQTTSNAAEGTDSDFDIKPDVDVDQDVTIGRVVKKRTAPQPVHAQAKKCNTGVCVQTSSIELMVNGIPACPELKDIGVQVNINVDQSGNSCNHCGITFQDITMYYVHMGCHSMNDPYECNVCGKGCSDRVSFQIHITRDHMK